MLINKNIDNFLQFRKHQIDIEKIEIENKCALPPVYKAFISSFQPVLGNVTFMNPESGEQEDFTSFVFSSTLKTDYTIDDDELSFESFIDPNDLFKNDQRTQYIKKYGVLPISYHGFGGGLVVGLNDDNLDKIYFSHDSEDMKFIAKNIFELLQRFQIVPVLYDHPELDEKKFYKKWGENFWRIKN